MTKISKLCSDHIRETFNIPSRTQGIKPTHAHELVAAFFGYKSHAALLCERKYPIKNLENADIFIPDIKLLELRRSQLNGLPKDLPSSLELAKSIVSFLQEQELFNGEIWLYESLKLYIEEELLPKEEDYIFDELSGEMAETNAIFGDEVADYNNIVIDINDENLTITASGVYKGDHDWDSMYCGDTIDMNVEIVLPRIAGKCAFAEYEISVSGQARNDWSDEQYPDNDGHEEYPNNEGDI